MWGNRPIPGLIWKIGGNININQISMLKLREQDFILIYFMLFIWAGHDFFKKSRYILKL